MNIDFWNQFFNSQSLAEIEENRRRLVLWFSSYIGGLVILIFSIKNFQTNNIVVSLILATSGVLILLNAVTSHFSRNTTVHCYISSIATAIMLFGLIYSGGHENTALYWLFPFPLVYFVLLGYKAGLALNIAVFVMALVLLNSPEFIKGEYRPEESTRFLASFFIAVLLGFIAEVFRYRSQSNIKSFTSESQKLALIDDLTKLLNRRFLETVFYQRLQEQPLGHLPVGVILADIDDFKRINDTMGHVAGDHVLRDVAAFLKGSFREKDAVVRYGGEEFLILLPGTSLKDTVAVAEKIRSNIANMTISTEEVSNLQVTFSVGAAVCDKAFKLLDAIKTADNHLYQAKSTGKNKVVSDLTATETT